MHPPQIILAALRTCAGGIAFLACTTAGADIYRCIAPGGETSYRDSPCAAEDAMSANITELVQACSTQECQDDRERARASAEERLQAERAALNEMQDRRLRAEQHELERRMQLEQLDRLQSLETQLAMQRAADSGVYYPGYPLYPGAGYPGYGGAGYYHPGIKPCKGVQCAQKPGLRNAHRRHFRKEPAVRSGVSLRRPR
jgi:hypothetical protein